MTSSACSRFYGAAFTLYGVLLIAVSADLEKYSLIMRCVLWVFLFAGMVRFVSVAIYGWPPPLMVELLLSPLLLSWFSRLQKTAKR